MAYEIEPRELIYRRSGILSQTTELNEELAERFMWRADIRRDIVIVDSGKEPEKQSVSVGDDVLAWRSIAPLTELTKSILKPKKFHQVEVVDNQYRVLIHDKIIDEDIKKHEYKNREEYERNFLSALNREIKGSASEILFNEKIGWKAQYPNLLYYVLVGGVMASDIASGNYRGVLVQLGTAFFVMHPTFNFFDNIRFRSWNHFNQLGKEFFSDYKSVLDPSVNPRTWKEACFPIVPVDKWVKGKKFLHDHGDDLVVTTKND